jgi:flagellar biosynthetic protein FliP
LRRAIGFSDLPSGLAVVGLAVALSLSTIPNDQKLPIFSALPRIESEIKGKENDIKVREILKRRSDPLILSRIGELHQRAESAGGVGEVVRGDGVATQVEVDKNSSEEVKAKELLTLEELIAAFALTEARGAFQMAIVFLIPFLVIDLLIALLVSSIGITTISSELLSFPLKIFFFVMLDGWTLVADNILQRTIF